MEQRPEQARPALAEEQPDAEVGVQALKYRGQRELGRRHDHHVRLGDDAGHVDLRPREHHHPGLGLGEQRYVERQRARARDRAGQRLGLEAAGHPPLAALGLAQDAAIALDAQGSGSGQDRVCVLPQAVEHGVVGLVPQCP